MAYSPTINTFQPNLMIEIDIKLKLETLRSTSLSTTLSSTLHSLSKFVPPQSEGKAN